MWVKGRMNIHIVGAGPTGMSLAWEILQTGNHEITIYDRKPSAGGSWWEPDTDTRDLHAHRIVFDKAFVNTHSLFREMKINWNHIFKPVKKDIYGFMYRSLQLGDYGMLASLATRVLTQPEKYRKISLKDAVGKLSESGQKFIQHLPLIMDGVTWDIMSAYEFVKNFDYVGLSKQYTQKVSGKVMCDKMQIALMKKGVNFVFGKELQIVEYFEDTYEATFTDEMVVNDGMLFLCIDNSPALKFLGDNWGSDADKKVRESTYGSINVLLDYDKTIHLGDDLEIASKTEWNLQPVVLSDGKTVSCVICNLTKDVLSSDPETIKNKVVHDLGLPPPREARIGWGSEWKEDHWEFTQSSGVLSLHGQLPFFGKCSKVAMCGMMSPRKTPFSSIEASVEVSRTLSHQLFNTRKPLQPRLVTDILTVVLLTLIVLILIYINRNQ
jgi:hypothetical protein